MPPAVAILGATSQLAADFIRVAARVGRDGGGNGDGPALVLFARDTGAVERRLAADGLAGRFPVAQLSAFGRDEHGPGVYGAVVNFVGVGDPARAKAMGAGIFAVTREWDDRVLAYLDRAPDTRYVFLSSGAAYGEAFDRPAGPDTAATFPVNRLGAANWYALAKFGAEAVHRAAGDRSIIDLRVFNYVSRYGDPAARFLISDAARAIRDNATMATMRQPIVRDYLCPDDFHALLSACLAAPAGTNAPADAYTAAPIAKDELLALLGERFGLRYDYADDAGGPAATGAKPCYYSRDRTAATWGYRPRFSSAQAIVREVAAMLGTPR